MCDWEDCDDPATRLVHNGRQFSPFEALCDHHAEELARGSR